MPYTIYNCDALTGGASRALDALSVASLSDKDRAFVLVGSQFIPFLFDASATDAEDVTNHPFKVRPDDFSTAGVWIEQVINADTLDGYDSTEFWRKAELGQFGYLINGGFDCDRRGTSFTSVSGTYTLERWQGLNAVDISRVWVSGISEFPGGVYGLRMQQAASNFARIQQPIESQFSKSLAGKYVTVSFWMYVVGGTSASRVMLFTPSVADDWSSTLTTEAQATVWDSASDPSGSWVKVEQTLGPLSSAVDKGLMLRLDRDTGGTSDTYFATVKLEEGTVATPFVALPDVEIYRCMRYYWEFVISGWFPAGIFRGSSSGTQMSGQPVPFPVNMRTSPTVYNLSPSDNVNYYGHNGAGTEIGAAGGLTAQTTPTEFYLKEALSNSNGAIYSGVATGSITLAFDSELY